MASNQTLLRFGELGALGYIPSIGAWVQVAGNLTTVLNAFNTLGAQDMELFLFDSDGNDVATYAPPNKLATNSTLRLDLATLLDPSDLPFEGSVWVWALGDGDEGHIGLQAIDLDFVDTTREAGYTAGSVHIIFDFLNTGNVGPFMDLVSPRLLVDRTPEGSERYLNYLGLAHLPFDETDIVGIGPELEISISNQAGETRVATQTIRLNPLGSWFGMLESLFPDLRTFLAGSGDRGYGSVNVQEKSGAVTGLAGMIKVVDMVTGELHVNHLNDRAFARPSQKG